MFGGDAGSPGRGEGAPAEGELAAAREELAAARRELAAARLEAQGFSQMGHEIRTHLSGVLGISGLLLSTELTPDQRELARRIRVSGEALLSILSDLRDFSRLEANALDVEPVDFDLRRAVEDVGDVLAERARDAGVELVALIRSEVPWMVRGDVARLRQILQSLATFAIRSCPGGDVALRASLAEDGGAAARVRFEVRYAPRPGEQAASGLGGGGLGIAVAKRLVDAMGGEIGAATEPGRGGCFWFVLPLARRGRSTDRGVIPRVDLAGKRALIADDSAAARDAVREMVEMLGMACDAVRDRAEAAAALRAATARGEPYDVVIVDAELPDEPRSAPEPAVHARGLRADEPRSAPEPPGDQLVEAALAAQTHLVPVLPPGAGSPSDASPPLTK
ncbi:MAG: hypothetical protein IT372_26175, partial [Polyangiaceae bacterium]|nr:hypothetical protein [Polyangiaceae bacterium]